jgi:hypothetical protein
MFQAMDPGAWGYIVWNLLEQQWRKLYTQLHDRIVSVRILLADWRPLVFCSNPCRMEEASVRTETNK